MKKPLPEVEPALGAPPRQVGYSRDGISTFWVSLGCLIAWVFLIPPFGIVHYDKLCALQSKGIPVQGTISGDWAKDADAPSYEVTYGYEYRGDSYVGRQYVVTALYPHRGNGHHVIINVLPDDPSFSHLGPVSQADLLQAQSFWKPWALMIALIGLMFMLIRRKVGKEWNLLQHGLAIHGTVVELKGSPKQNSTITFTYKYDTESGEKSGKTSALRRYYPGIVVGSELLLLCDPDNPEHCIPRGQLTLVRLVDT